MKSSAGLYAAALTLAAAIFISDLLTPVSLGVWFLYVIPLALTALGHDSDVPLYAAAGTTLLIAITLITDARTAGGAALAVAEFNRGCGVVVIWTLALLVRSVVSTRLRMEADRWLRAQESQLLSQFQGDLTLSDIAQRTLDLLAEALRAPVACLYISEGSTLTLVATRGLRAGSDVPESFALGEGLIGQAAQSRRTTTLEDLAADLLPIRSSLIHGSTPAVTIWPVIGDGTLHAVIEFGGMRRPPARGLELLEAVQREVAVALRAARYRGQLRELLEKTQRQSDDAELMLGVVGHDLRTPLGAINTGAELLLSNYADDPMITRIARPIVSSSRRMTRLISQLLDFANARLGSLPIHKQSVDLAELAEASVAESETSGHAVTFMRNGQVRGHWDPDRLSQVLSNLIENAVNHGGDGDPVRVTVEADGDAAVIDVRNRGEIPADVVDTLFVPFARAQASTSAGSGLGLYITDQIVRAHGGTVHGSTVDGWTLFRVRLPRG